jgi:hypothetical protein
MRKLRCLSQEMKVTFKKHILRAYYKIRHMSKVEARREILMILAKSKGYNTHFFRGEVYIDDYGEVDAWIGIQKDRFLVVEPDTGREMRSIAFSLVK